MKDDGGAAFGTFERVGECERREGGLSIRDWFAGQALMGILANEKNEHDDKSYEPDGAAERAFRFASAMLAERAKGKR